MDGLGPVLVHHGAEAGTAQLQIGHQFGQALLQGLAGHQLGQGDLGAVLQGVADMAGQPCRVDKNLVKQLSGVDVFIARLQHQVGNHRLNAWGDQGALHGQCNVCAGLRHFHHVAGCRRVAQRQRLAFDAVQDVHDAAVFLPGLIIEKTAQLLGQGGDGALGMFARFHPVVVNAAGAGVRVQVGHSGQCQHAIEQRGQLLLPAAGQQKIPEGAKALALVGIGYRFALAHDVFEQCALAALPQRDALAHTPVQLAKIVLNLAKVGQQLPRTLRELLKAVLQRGVVQQRHIARLHPGDFGVDFSALFLQLGDALGRVGFAALAHLFEQVKQREQARLGAHELPLAQLRQPGNGLFGGGRQIELGLVCARAVKLAQPALVVRSPIVQILQRRLRESGFTQVQAQGIQGIFQRLGQIRRRHHPHIGHHEHPVQKAGHQRRMVRAQQPPRRVVAAQGVKGGVV